MCEMDNHTDSVNKAGSGDSADVYNKVYELAVNRFRQLADDLAPKVGSIPLIREPYSVPHKGSVLITATEHQSFSKLSS